MADEDAAPDAEVVVVEIGGEPPDDGVVVPKETPPPPDPGSFSESGASPEPEPEPDGPIDISNGSSSPEALEQLRGDGSEASPEPPPPFVDVGDTPPGTVELEDEPRERTPPGQIDVNDGTSNTIVLEEEPPRDRGAETEPELRPVPPDAPVVEEPPKNGGKPAEDGGTAGVAAEKPQETADPVGEDQGTATVVEEDQGTADLVAEDQGTATVVEEDQGTAAVAEEPQEPAEEPAEPTDTAAPPAVEDGLDLPTELFHDAPAFATGAGTQGADGAPTATDAAPAAGHAPADLDAAEPVAVDEYEGSTADPLEVVAAEEDDDEDDPGFFEQVADKVGDLWDDATDAVT